MTEPVQGWEPTTKYQRDLEPGELEELNRLRAWKEQQEREAQSRQIQEQQRHAHQQRLAYEEHQRRIAEQQRASYQAPYYAQPHYAPIQQVTVHNMPARAECPHLLHFVLTLITCGMWLPVWIIHAIYVASKS
ncbi:hypothetical protein EV641_10845 [Rhodococcus sp. SMB37]|uniref:hypothetical protein n=1 Tax=Rhodococcus sp. SMB37 TaxID=2512213 RepID=UPI00104DDE69|nr:hypothetical protein [Rhodococcus sp. SMB37]TCN52169.1 hypothetical protein EV641_10845 [Rhodococcus sp. SMB37]